MFTKYRSLLSAVALCLAGCASNPVQVNPNDSKALNIAKAAGLGDGLTKKCSNTQRYSQQHTAHYSPLPVIWL